MLALLARIVPLSSVVAEVALAVLCVIFSGFILIPVGQDVWRFVRPSDDPKWWWYFHLDRMMGSYIGAVTAFAVNQLGPRVPQAMQIFVWVGPAMVLVPMIVIWKGYYRRKFAKKPVSVADGSVVTLTGLAGS